MLNVEYRELAERNEELTEGQTDLIRLFDGERSCRQAIYNAALPDLAALEAVSQLYFEGLIAVAQPTDLQATAGCTSLRDVCTTSHATKCCRRTFCSRLRTLQASRAQSNRSSRRLHSKRRIPQSLRTPTKQSDSSDSNNGKSLLELKPMHRLAGPPRNKDLKAICWRHPQSRWILQPVTRRPSSLTKP